MHSPTQTTVHLPSFLGIAGTIVAAQSNAQQCCADQGWGAASETDCVMSRARRPAALLAAAAMLAATIGAQAYAPHTAPRSDFELAADTCAIPSELAHFEHPLSRFAQRLAAREPVRIVAIGSSSTYGEGASSPRASYPRQLARALAQAFPAARITVLNRGVNGDT